MHDMLLLVFAMFAKAIKALTESSQMHDVSGPPSMAAGGAALVLLPLHPVQWFPHSFRVLGTALAARVA